MLTADERGNLKALDERIREALILGRAYEDNDPSIGRTTPWIVEAINGLAADIAELKARPPVTVDPAMLEAALRKVIGAVDGATP